MLSKILIAFALVAVVVQAAVTPKFVSVQEANAAEAAKADFFVQSGGGSSSGGSGGSSYVNTAAILDFGTAPVSSVESVTWSFVEDATFTDPFVAAASDVIYYWVGENVAQAPTADIVRDGANVPGFVAAGVCDAQYPAGTCVFEGLEGCVDTCEVYITYGHVTLEGEELYPNGVAQSIGTLIQPPQITVTPVSWSEHDFTYFFDVVYSVESNQEINLTRSDRAAYPACVSDIAGTNAAAVNMEVFHCSTGFFAGPDEVMLNTAVGVLAFAPQNQDRLLTGFTTGEISETMEFSQKGAYLWSVRGGKTGVGVTGLPWKLYQTFTATNANGRTTEFQAVIHQGTQAAPQVFDLTVTAADTTAEITSQFNGDSVSYLVVTEGSVAPDAATIIADGSTSTSVTGLDEAVAYVVYAVATATDDAGSVNSVVANATFTTLDLTGPTITLGAVTTSVADVAGTFLAGIDVAYTTTEDASIYTQFVTGAATGVAAADVVVFGFSTDTVAHSSLAVDTQYTVYVVGVDAAGNIGEVVSYTFTSESAPDLCADVTCQNGGACDSTDGACVCAEGYNGDLCQDAIDTGATGLVAYYPFDDSTSKDIVGDNDGVDSNVAYVNGVSGKALVAGVYSADSHVAVADAEAFQFTDEFSIAFWYNRISGASEVVDSDADDIEFSGAFGDDVEMSCPFGFSIRVVRGSYGNAGYGCNNYGSLAKAVKDCDKQQSCTVSVTSNQFQDACFGFANAFVGAYICERDSRVETLVSQQTLRNEKSGFSVYATQDNSYDGNSISVRFQREHGRQTLTLDGVSEDSWHFIAVTFTAAEQTLYVDGNYITETKRKNNGGISTSFDGLTFGNEAADEEYQANCGLDEIKLWNVALTAAEIDVERSQFGQGPFEINPIPTEDPNLEVFDPSTTGCSDGSREGFKDEAEFPYIAACAAGWSVPGLTDEATFAHQCDGSSGNDGQVEGCSVADACALGWHVCSTAGDVRFSSMGADAVDGDSGLGCSAVSDFEAGFFATRQSGHGNRYASDIGQNDVFGCGDGDSYILNAAGLNAFSHNNCNRLDGSWSCSTPSGLTEAAVITHSSSLGGVLCCADTRFSNTVTPPADDEERIEVPIEIDEDEDDEETCKLVARAIKTKCKSKKKSSNKKKSGYDSSKAVSIKSIKVKCLRVFKSKISQKSVKSAGSDKSSKSSGSSNSGKSNRRMLLQTAGVSSYMMFDISPSEDIDAASAVFYLNEAIYNGEMAESFPTLESAETLKQCSDGSSQYTCDFVNDREEEALPAGASAEYDELETGVLANDSPVVIGLIVTLVVVVLAVLVGVIYRFKFASKNAEQSFDASIMNANTRSDDVNSTEMAPVEGKQGEQDTYWVFNRDNQQWSVVGKQSA